MPRKKGMMLYKALYGLKQALRAWNKKIDDFLRKKEFVKCIIVYGVYVRQRRDELLILYLYVDDMLITWSCKKKIEDFKYDLSKEFEMSELDNISYFLDIEFNKFMTCFLLLLYYIKKIQLIVWQRNCIKKRESFKLVVCIIVIIHELVRT